MLTAIINANVNTDSLPISISLSITLSSYYCLLYSNLRSDSDGGLNRLLREDLSCVSIFVSLIFFLLRVLRCQTQLKLSSLRFMNSCMIV